MHKELKDTNSGSTGFFAAINNCFDLGNINKEHSTRNLPVDHPGWETYTPYQDCNATVISVIEARQELYTEYDAERFKRKAWMNVVPFSINISKVQTLMKNMEHK